MSVYKRPGASTYSYDFQLGGNRFSGDTGEPKERVREASQAEEAAFMDVLDRGYDDAVAFALLTGCRRMEIVGLTWQRVDFFTRQFTVVGKGGKSRTIPMSDAVFLLLWDQKDHDPV